MTLHQDPQDVDLLRARRQRLSYATITCVAALLASTSDVASAQEIPTTTPSGATVVLEVTTAPSDAPATAPVTMPSTAPATLPTTLPASATTMPATIGATAPGAATRPNGNGVHGITTQPSGGLLLNFQDASIDTVLNELSAAAGFIIVKEVKPEGRVTLVSKQPVTGADAVSLLNTVVRNAGYAAIQQGRILKIVQADAAKRLNIPVRSGADPTKIEPTDELITQVIPLRYADAVQLKQDLTPLVNGNADFTANASSNALVITDTSANIRRVVEIVNALDTHLADATDVKVFQLKFANAAGAAKLINDVFGTYDQISAGGQQGNQGGRRNQGGGGGGGGGNQGGGGDGGGGGDFRARIGQFFQQQQQQQGGGGARQQNKINASSDERTNTIVVSGAADTLLVVERVVKEIDSNPAAEESVFIYHLKNGNALNVESVMNMLFNGTSAGNRTNATLQGARTTVGGAQNRSGGGGTFSGATGRGGGGGGGTFGGGGTGGGTFGGNNGGGGGGAFGGNANNNNRGGGNTGGAGNVSRNAMSAASDLAGEVAIIADPDTNALLIRTAPKNFDRVRAVLDELDRAVAQVLIKVLIAEVTHTNARDLGAEFSVLNLGGTGAGTGGTNFGLTNAAGDVTDNSGLVIRTLGTQVTATLRLLETTGKLDVLSRPYILASDNQLASITVGQEIPFVTNSRVTDTGQTINTIQYGDIGILLDVIPHINPDGLVILDVAPEISALTGDSIAISDQASAPIIAKRSAQSRVGVRNGQTIVIGGLMEDRKTTTINKVPILGDIPLVGALFRRKVTSKSKTELLIFLTPQVASRPESLAPMSKDEVNGYKLAPNAVAPGSFDQHLRNLQRGHDPLTTQPADRGVEANPNVPPPDDDPAKTRGIDVMHPEP